jgi:hypothetical protein
VPKTFQIPVIAGGRLVTSISTNMVGPSDYVQKVNWLRDRDQEIRRHGYLKFNPLAGPTDEYIFDASLTCYKLFELVRGDGTKAILGFSRSSVRLFDNTLGTWSTIGSGYSSSGKRWQVLAINGTLVANNAVDLPFYWNIGDAAVTPMKELREVGVASVGRIQENNGFLIIADITEIFEEVLPLFMRGWSTFTSGTTTAKAANFTITNGEVDDTFNVTTGASTITATLPASPPTDFYVFLKKQDNGAGRVVTSPVIAVSPVNLTTQNDLALVFWDAAEEEWVSVTFPLGVIPADATYTAPPSYITQRLPWSVANSEFGEPTMWAPAYNVLMPSASTSLVLPFPSSVFIAGQTRVAVINGGPLGGALGGQENSPNGILVTAVSGRTLTIEETTDTDLAYPRVVTVVRWEDVSSLVGRYDLTGDNSAITSLANLRDWLVVFRETGIYMGRYTGDPGAPFVFTPKYQGTNVPLWPDAIGSVKADYLLYPAVGGRVIKFDGVTWPEIHEVTDAAASLFFNGYDQTDEVYSVDNPITKEIFFCYPDTTLCFDYDTPGGTLSEFDQNFDAAAVAHKTGTTDLWFIMAIGRFIYTYGLVYGITNISTWLRDGVAVESVMKFGLNAFGDQSNEKLLLNLTPILSSSSPDVDLEVQIYGTYNPNATPTALLVPAESLPTPQGDNFVALAFQRLYAQDEITLTETSDIDARYSMRIWEVELVKAGGVTRSVP